MSVLIKGMKMPSCCSDCRLFSDAWCLALGYDWRKAYNRPPDGERLAECPLVEIPTPHGRLIDGDECSKFLEENWYGIEVFGIIDHIDNRPTIIEAEGGGEEC